MYMYEHIAGVEMFFFAFGRFSPFVLFSLYHLLFAFSQPRSPVAKARFTVFSCVLCFFLLSVSEKNNLRFLKSTSPSLSYIVVYTVVMINGLYLLYSVFLLVLNPVACRNRKKQDRRNNSNSLNTKYLGNKLVQQRVQD